MRSTQDLYSDFAYTLQQCSSGLLSASDDEIGYKIFEEFDIGVVSFLHPEVLDTLWQAGLISKKIVGQCILLRDAVLYAQTTDDWNIHAVRKAESWRSIMQLTDKIRLAMQIHPGGHP